jgi:hypothetical protein
VENRTATGRLEQILGLPVGQAGPAALRIDVAVRELDAGPALGQEHGAVFRPLSRRAVPVCHTIT